MNYTVQLAGDLEAELDRIKAATPHLAARVGRAGDILVTHMSCPRQRVIRIRVGSDGKARFLVNGSHGKVYEIDPSTWACTCLDTTFRNKGCKHAIACFALDRAGRKPARRKHRVSKPKTGTRHESESLRGVLADFDRLEAIPTY